MAPNKIQMTYRIREVAGGSYEISKGIWLGVFIPLLHYENCLSLSDAEKFIEELKRKKQTYYR
jgi:hypothetical protein